MMKYIIIIVIIIVLIGLLLSNEIFNIGNIFGNKDQNLQKIEDQLKNKLEDKKNIDNKKTSNKIISNKETSNKITSNKIISNKITSNKLTNEAVNKTKKVIEKLTTDDQSELNFDNSDIFNDYNKINSNINLDESDMSFDGSINNTIIKDNKKNMKEDIKTEMKKDIKTDMKKESNVNEKLFKDFQKYMEKVNEKKNITKMHKLAEEISKKQPVFRQQEVKKPEVKQPVIKQNGSSNVIDTLSLNKHSEVDNNDDFDLTDTISGIINNELNNA